MAQGFAFGTGSALAREAVGSVMGAFSGGQKPEQPKAHEEPRHQQQNVDVCAPDHKAFMQCLQEHSGNASNCEQYFNALQACQSSRF